MSSRPRTRFPSPTFIGTLIGVGYTLGVSPASFHPSAAGIVVRLLFFSGLGMLAGAAAEAIVARRWRDSA
jgi:hypothetical protein